MKKLLTILCLVALTTCAFAQGTINFITAGPGFITDPPSPPGMGFYFALLTAPVGTTDPTAFTFSGVYATNLVNGGIFGRNGVAVPGWVPGTSRSFEVAGWDAAAGVAWNPSWLTDSPSGRRAGGMTYWGVSVIGSGFAGGVDPVTGGQIPSLNIFGGAPSINSPIVLQVQPEPGSAALAALGAAVLLIFRRRGRLGPG